MSYFWGCVNPEIVEIRTHKLNKLLLYKPENLYSIQFKKIYNQKNHLKYSYLQQEPIVQK